MIKSNSLALCVVADRALKFEGFGIGQIVYVEEVSVSTLFCTVFDFPYEARCFIELPKLATILWSKEIDVQTRR